MNKSLTFVSRASARRTRRANWLAHQARAALDFTLGSDSSSAAT